MNSTIRFVALVAGLVLLMHVTPSWGQPTCASPGCNPTVSDANGNTAGGTATLLVVPSGPMGGFYNTAFGDHALAVNGDGDANTAYGASALQSNTGGGSNTACGAGALFSNTTGSYNTASGVYALLNNTTSDNNTANGAAALKLNTTGTFNTAIGAGALFSNNGTFNTAGGYAALTSNTLGTFNTASGANALSTNSIGVKNTALGTDALAQSTGNKNIAIGFQAGTNLTTGHNNIYVGNLGGVVEYQTIRIGTAQTSTFIAGIATASVGNASTVEIDTTTGQLGIPLSSARYKQDIAPMGTQSEKLLQLRPVTFAYRDDVRAMTHYGLIAEEVAAVLPELVTRTAAGEVHTVKYHALIPMLLNELQRQQRELAELRALVARHVAGQRMIAVEPRLTQLETDEGMR